MHRRPALRRAAGALVIALVIALAVGVAGPPLLERPRPGPRRSTRRCRAPPGSAIPTSLSTATAASTCCATRARPLLLRPRPALGLDPAPGARDREPHARSTSTCCSPPRRSASTAGAPTSAGSASTSSGSSLTSRCGPGSGSRSWCGTPGSPAGSSYVGERNWLADADEVVTMNEPHMAPWWFPANDHPLDKATLRHPHHRAARHRGRRQRPASRSATAGRVDAPTTGAPPTRWRPISRSSPPVTSSSSAAARTDFPGSTPCRAACPGHQNGSRCAGCARRRGSRRGSSSELGDYPFDSTGGLVTGLNPGFALENQTRPTYPFVGGSATCLLVHELAHQWFGDSVSVAGAGATSGSTRGSPATSRRAGRRPTAVRAPTLAAPHRTTSTAPTRRSGSSPSPTRGRSGSSTARSTTAAR